MAPFSFLNLFCFFSYKYSKVNLMKKELRTFPIFLRPLLKLTHHSKTPTDKDLDEKIERLKFQIKGLQHLFYDVMRSKIKRIFKYYKIDILKGMSIIAVFLFAAYIFVQNPFKSNDRIVYKQAKSDTVKLMGITLIKNMKEIYVDPSRADLTKDNVDYFLSEFGIKYWYIVRKQIMQESGMTSNICLNGHNLFGMKFPHQRETCAVGVYSGHAAYKHWIYSLYDYKLWQDYELAACPIKVKESYYDWLVRVGYSTSPEYIETLKNVVW